LQEKRLKIIQLVTAGIIPLLAIFRIPYSDKVTALPGDGEQALLLLANRIEMLSRC
jgi:hypothetical protein